MQRIGLFGGSFNPVTYGHLGLARAAWETLALDRLYFIPAAQSPFKPHAPPAPGPLRLRWLRLALAGWSGCVVDDTELRRGGISYTVDTVAEFRRRHPEAELFWILGADQAHTLPQWHAAMTLAQWVQFAVCPRPGQPPPQLAPPFRGRLVEAPLLGVSASLVRQRAAAGLPLDGLTPPAVAEDLMREKVYS
ncbi:MAG: nicotinate (nicotinamide) nucleotide adenylyltransferase [Verrucomicrobiae bacterium]|nr:nicotinate (nicotinamide) nucleotide adenylyltransferase [Verrucomicrobiae bacterium]